MPIVVLELPLEGKIGINPDSVTKVTRESGRVFVWQGAQKIEAVGSFEKILATLNGKGLKVLDN